MFSNSRQVCEPIYPAPPVTRTVLGALAAKAKMDVAWEDKMREIKTSFKLSTVRVAIIIFYFSFKAFINQSGCQLFPNV
jgi:hypothetical protein